MFQSSCRWMGAECLPRVLLDDDRWADSCLPGEEVGYFCSFCTIATSMLCLSMCWLINNPFFYLFFKSVISVLISVSKNVSTFITIFGKSQACTNSVYQAPFFPHP